MKTSGLRPNTIWPFERPFVIDGGLSNQLESKGIRLDNSLWTASALVEQPDSIVETHLDYLEAGADCIITSSYQATIQGFMAAGYSEQESEHLIDLTVELAGQAREQFLSQNPGVTKPLIAGSIGPYGAFLADGSEYRGNYGLSDQQLTDFHQPRIDILGKSVVDILACETIPSYQEAEVLVRCLEGVEKPSWISFTFNSEETLWDGTAAEECAALIEKSPAVSAIGINCTRPEFVLGLLRRIQPHIGEKRIVVYPNSGETYNPVSKTWGGSSTDHLDDNLITEWLAAGATGIGGCCRIGPRTIERVHTLLTREGPH